MKRFFLRELRRQAPIALASLALGALVLAAGEVAGTFVHEPFQEDGLAFGGFLLVLTVAPLLLAVGSVVPDTESGAVAFLARLPHSRARELAVRWGVAAGLAALAIALDALMNLLVAGSVHGGDGISHMRDWGFALLPLTAFAGGVAASVAFRRAMSALAAAPFVVVPAVALLRVADLAGSESSLGMVLLSILVAVLAVAGAAAFFRGQIHRRSLRPAAIVLGSVAAFTLLMSGAVYGWDAVAGRWKWVCCTWRDPGGRHVFQQVREGGFGLVDDPRFVLVERDRPDRVIPIGVPLASSPDGKRLLAHAESGRGLELVDFATGAHETWDVRVVATPSVNIGVQGEGVAWRKGRPIVARVPRAWFVDRGWSQPGGAIESAAASRLIMRDEGSGRHVWDLDRDARIPSALDALPEGVTLTAARLSPDGTRIVARGELEGRPFAFFMPVEGGRTVRLELSALDAANFLYAWSGRDRVSVALTVGASRRLVTLEVATGEVHAGPPILGVVWDVSPSGTRVLDSDRVLDVQTLAAKKFNATGLFDEEQLYRVSDDGSSIDLVDIATGAVKRFR